MSTLYGYARMVCAGTLNYLGGGMGCATEDSARYHAEMESRTTSLTVVVFSYSEARIKDGTVTLGGYEEGRELTQEEAARRLARGYGAMHEHPAGDPDTESRSGLIRHLHAHPDHAGNYPAGHDFVLVSTVDVRRAHERQHPAKGNERAT